MKRPFPRYFGTLPNYFGRMSGLLLVATLAVLTACGAQEDALSRAPSDSAALDKEIANKLQNERFAKAYEDIDLDFQDFLEDQLDIWTGTDESRYQAYKQGYADLFRTIVIRPERLGTVDWYISTIVRNRARYEQIERATGVPWFWVGITHGLEGSFDFSRHLHNGDSLNARTWQVPAGRPSTGTPPFSWEFSATDAVVYKGYDAWKNWGDPTLHAYSFEKYNGFGYRSTRININSPYLWSFSNHYTKGKYTYDGYYDPNAGSEQAGAMVILKRGLDRGIFKLEETNVAPVIVKSTDRPALDSLLYSGVSDSADVMLLKLRLRSYGYNVGVLDRRFDSALDSAVRSFQSENGLVSDGVVGNGTWSVLWPTLADSNWMTSYGVADGVDVRAMRGSRCLFRVVSKDAPQLTSFLKSTISANTISFRGEIAKAQLVNSCPDVREAYNVSKGTTEIDPTLPGRIPGTPTKVTWHSVQLHSQGGWNISSFAGSKLVETINSRVKADIVRHLEKHARANSVVSSRNP
jgi:lysozyme family protein/peptidoglycan hydrolase-like protein with peptidoglycan-binding domain